MRSTLLSVIFLFVFHNSSLAQPYEIQKEIKRIVFIGNSITYSGKYIEYIDTYLSVRYTDKDYEIINVGLPSETVSGLSEINHANGAFPRPDLHDRLDSIISQTQPDLVLSCYGMNDGIYLPFDDERFQKFKDGVNWLNDTVEQSGADIIHITPPIYDERKGPAYANVLDIYSDWLISKRYTANWKVIDIHWPMRKMLESQRQVDSTFVFAKDGVHPNEAGHFEIAKHILLNLGETELRDLGELKSYLAIVENGEQILNLIEQKHKIMKDAWLTSIGHQRPRMDMGLPIAEAISKAKVIDSQIDILLISKR